MNEESEAKLEINKIYNQDCLEGLQRIKDGQIDSIVTDPPYCVGTTSNGSKGSWHDNNLVIPFFDKLFKQWNRVLRESGTVYVNTDWRTYPFLYPLLYKYFNIKNCIVWDYEWIKAGSHYRFSHEFIIFAVKGDSPRMFSAKERDVWRIRPINFTDINNKLHQTQKPEDLVRKMVSEGSKEGDLILDCFCGSGTVPVVSKKERRNFIGFEIDEEMWNVANKRVGEMKEFVRLDTFSKFESAKQAD
jgi:site-specific DNA-methyltransferase (adenine-specific)